MTSECNWCQNSSDACTQCEAIDWIRLYKLNNRKRKYYKCMSREFRDSQNETQTFRQKKVISHRRLRSTSSTSFTVSQKFTPHPNKSRRKPPKQAFVIIVGFKLGSTKPFLKFVHRKYSLDPKFGEYGEDEEICSFNCARLHCKSFILHCLGGRAFYSYQILPFFFKSSLNLIKSLV